MMDEMNRDACGPATACPHMDVLSMAAAATQEGIGRRSFLTQGMILAAAAALTACGGGDVTGPTSVPAGSTVDITQYSALATTGGVAMVKIGNASLAIVRTGTSTFAALSRRCPHEGQTINQQGTGFRCPSHGATFDSTGKWTGGQKTSSMTSYKTSFDSSTNILTIG
jgi:thiosulfate dehydrogenase [quinone] large subunit